jgi:thioredoxin-like negative regulator of GroEL
MKKIEPFEIDEAIGNEEIVCLYLYTPMCGTCQLAKRMLEVVEELFPFLPFYQTDINYMPERAAAWKIESVPCLLLFQGGNIVKKWYAFHSVPYLYETIKEMLPNDNRFCTNRKTD